MIKKFIPQKIVSLYHFILSFLGALIYRFPSKKIKVIGVTGTSGKTTTVDLITKVFEGAGYNTASMSSIKFKIKNKEKENDLKMTMPGRAKIQKFLRKAVKEKCQYAILEVTSEGIKQHRHRFINFNVSVFTNLSPEHIESHGGFEKYKECKGKLFKKTKETHILNLDDKNTKYFLNFHSNKKILFSIEEESDIKAEKIETSSSGISFTVKNTNFKLNLLGQFNVYNALSAIAVGFSQGISLQDIKKSIEKAKGVPGRMEIVIKDPFTVIVDYAITPVALEKVYQTISSNSLICVLGSCGGGRDKWKRPVFGKIASKYCKKIILTNEDPYDEDPMEIINQVAEGAKNNAEKILDRKKAIKRSLQLANKGDTVVVTGKGCEPWMCVSGGKKIPWDDRKIIKEEFNRLRNS